MMAKIETMEVIAPAPWATALVYGDFSGIEDDAENPNAPALFVAHDSTWGPRAVIMVMRG